MSHRSTNISHLRREYSHSTLDESSVDPDPVALFTEWLAQALKAELPEPNAMTVATATADGEPSARVVLLRGYDERGFVFFTDYRSQKGVELSTNPRTALVFYWSALDRQVRIVGSAAKISREESEAYFRTRPRGSRLGAWISHQSQVIPSRRGCSTTRCPSWSGAIRGRTFHCRPTGRIPRQGGDGGVLAGRAEPPARPYPLSS